MSAIEDVYEVKTTSSLGGLKAATDALKGHEHVIMDVAVAAATASGKGVRALISGVKSLAGMSLSGLQKTVEGVGKAINSIKTGAIDAAKKGLSGLGQVGGGVLKILGGIPQQFFFVTQMLGTLSQSVAGFLTAAAESSPKLKAQLDKLGATFGAVKSQVLGAFAGAIMPALAALGKAMDDPRFKAFITLLSDYLGKAVGWLADQFTNKLLPAFLAFLPKVEIIAGAVVSFFSAIKGGQNPLLALTNAVYAIGRALGLNEKDLSKFSDGMAKVRQVVAWVQDFIANKAMPAIQGAIKLAADWWKKHSQEIGAAIMAMWGAIEPILKSLWAELSKLWAEVGPQLIKAFKDIYTEVIPTVMAIANWIKDHSDDIIAVVRSLVNIVGGAIKILLDYLQTAVRIGMAVIRGDWSGAWTLVKDIAVRTWATIKDMLANFLEGVLHLVGTNTKAFIKTWQDNWKLLTTVVSTVAKNVSQSIASWWSGLVASVKGFFSNLAATWRANWDMLRLIVNTVLANVVKGLLDFVAKAKSSLVNGIQAVIDAVYALWQAGWQFVLDFLKKMVDAIPGPIRILLVNMLAVWKYGWNLIVSFLFDVWDRISSSVSKFLSNLITTWRNNWNNLLTILQSIVGSIVGAVSSLGSQVISAVTSFLSSVSSIWRTGWNALSAIVSTVWGAIVSTVSTFINTVSSTISSVMSTISSAWSSVWNTISGVVSDIWDTISGLVSGGIDAIKGFMDGLKTALQAPWSALGTFVSGVWNGIVGAVTGGINAVIGVINAFIRAYNAIIAAIPGGVPLPEIPPIGAAAAAQSVVAGAVTSGSNMRASAAMPGNAGAASASVMQPAASFVINVYGPFGPGYTPEQAGAAAANSFVTTARAQGVRV